MTPAQRAAQQHEQRQKDWDTIRELAMRQGLMLVKLSPRRWLVIRHQSMSGSVFSHEGGPRRTHMSGHVKFGPATEEACKAWISENGTIEVPADLLQ